MDDRVMRVMGEGVDLEAIRDLWLEYARSLDFHICFEGFQAELKALPGDYLPPSGGLFLVRQQGEPSGCVAFRAIEPGVAELRRLYVSPRWRRRGLARRLAETAVRDAAGLGFSMMRLETLPSMTAARALYESLGFKIRVRQSEGSEVGSPVVMELALVDRGPH